MTNSAFHSSLVLLHLLMVCDWQGIFDLHYTYHSYDILLSLCINFFLGVATYQSHGQLFPKCHICLAVC